MAGKRKAPEASPRVDDMIYRYSSLTDAERRQFDRKHQQFRSVRKQFGGVFERMAQARPAPAPATPAKGS